MKKRSKKDQEGDKDSAEEGYQLQSNDEMDSQASGVYTQSEDEYSQDGEDGEGSDQSDEEESSEEEVRPAPAKR